MSDEQRHDPNLFPEWLHVLMVREGDEDENWGGRVATITKSVDRLNASLSRQVGPWAALCTSA